MAQLGPVKFTIEPRSTREYRAVGVDESDRSPDVSYATTREEAEKVAAIMREADPAYDEVFLEERRCGPWIRVPKVRWRGSE